MNYDPENYTPGKIFINLGKQCRAKKARIRNTTAKRAAKRLVNKRLRKATRGQAISHFWA